MNNPFQKTFRLTLIASAVVTSGASFAAGFGLMEQSVDSSRNVYAGQQAKCNDPSYEAANPAMEVCIKKPELAVGMFAIPVDAKVKSGTWTNPGATATSDIHGIESNIIGLVPNMDFVMPISSEWSVGFGAYSMAGLQTDYTTDVIAKSIDTGAPTNTSILTLDLNPSVAYSITPALSVGAGLDVVYGDADYDAVLLPGTDQIKNSLSGWGVGYNAGLLYRFNNTKIGLSYRSKVTVKANGQMTSILGNANNSASLPIPQSAALGVSQAVGKFDLLATVKYTNWSVLKDLIIKNGSFNTRTFQPGDADANLNFQDSWFESVGFDYHWSDKITIGIGVGHDGTVTQDGYRDLRLPGADRYTVGLGGSYVARSGLKLNFAYQHIFSSDVKVNSSKRSDAGASGYAIATVAVNANVIGFGATTTF